MIICDACRRKARYGAAIVRKSAMEARFVLCEVHATNLFHLRDCEVWLLPGEREWATTGTRTS